MEMISHSIPQADDAFSDLLQEVPKLSATLHIMQAVMRNVGSSCFLIGASCMYPKYSAYCMGFECIMVGSVLFVVGSLCWCISSIVSFKQNSAYSTNRRSLIFNSVTLILADIFFCLGSVFLIPAVANFTVGYHVGGIVLFIVGSLLLTIAFAQVIYRAFHLLHLGHIELQDFLLLLLVAGANSVGSVCFIVGSVFRLASVRHSEDSTSMYLAGSIAFLAATLAAPFAVSVWMHTIATGQASESSGYAAVVGDSMHSLTGKVGAGHTSETHEDYAFVG